MRLSIEFDDGSRVTQHGSNIFEGMPIGKRLSAYWVNGKRIPIIGEVKQDAMMLDLLLISRALKMGAPRRLPPSGAAA